MATPASAAPLLAWSRADGTASVDNALGISLDSAGNIYAAGWTDGAFAGATNAGSSDVFVAQFASDGTRRWVKQFGSKAADVAVAIATDRAGTSYVLGNTYGKIDGTTDQTAGDVFLAKFSKNGTEVWRRQFGSAQSDQAGGLALDVSGNVYVVGSTEGAFAGNVNTGETDIFYAKYFSTGAQAWVKQFGTTNFDYGFGIAVDSWGTIAVVGETQGQFPNMRETGIADAFVATFAPDGTLRWLKQENSGPDFAYNRFTSVVMDDYENIIVAGSTGGSYTEDTVVAGPSDAVVVGYNRYLQRSWVRQFGTNAGDSILGMSRSPSGEIFVVGNTQGRVYGYLGPSGNSDAFVASLSSAGKLTWLRQYGTKNNEQFASVIADARGNVFAAGFASAALVPGLVTKSEDSVLMKWSSFAALAPPSRVVGIGKLASQWRVVTLAKLTAPVGSTVKLSVPSAYRSRCSVVKTSVKGLRRGECRVTVSVTNKLGVKRTGIAVLTVK